MEERVDIKQFDLANEKVVEPICLYFELHDRYLIYIGEYYCEVPVSEDKEDHSLGWQQQYSKFKIKIKRESIVSVELNYVPKREIYKVEMEANGYPTSISFYFQTEKEAENIYEKLDKYIFS